VGFCDVTSPCDVTDEVIISLLTRLIARTTGSDELNMTSQEGGDCKQRITLTLELLFITINRTV